jgi:hypothetical protein
MQQGNSVRDRLLARLPQPGNLQAYREETASLMEKHEKALLWERRTGYLLLIVAIVFLESFLLAWKHQIDERLVQFLGFIAAMLFLSGAFDGVRQFIYRNQVNLLKEIKQVQLQVLELQASLRKGGDSSL